MATIIAIKVYLDDTQVSYGQVSDDYKLDQLRDIADQWVGATIWNRIEVVDLDPRL